MLRPKRLLLVALLKTGRFSKTATRVSSTLGTLVFWNHSRSLSRHLHGWQKIFAIQPYVEHIICFWIRHLRIPLLAIFAKRTKNRSKRWCVLPAAARNRVRENFRVFFPVSVVLHREDDHPWNSAPHQVSNWCDNNHNYGHQSDQDQVYDNRYQTETSTLDLVLRGAKNDPANVGTPSFRYNHSRPEPLNIVSVGTHTLT